MEGHVWLSWNFEVKAIPFPLRSRTGIFLEDIRQVYLERRADLGVGELTVKTTTFPYELCQTLLKKQTLHLKFTTLKMRNGRGGSFI